MMTDPWFYTICGTGPLAPSGEVAARDSRLICDAGVAACSEQRHVYPGATSSSLTSSEMIQKLRRWLVDEDLYRDG